MSDKSRRQQIEEMLVQEPGDPFLRYCLAMEHKGEGSTDGALACFRELLAQSPDYVPAYLQLGQLLSQLGEEDEARTIFRRGIAEAQKKGDAHAANEMTGFLAMLE